MTAATALKLMTRTEWEAAQQQGQFDGSAADLHDGFIHMSTEAQVAETARKHFAGQSDLVLLSVDLTALPQPAVWEPSRGGDLFPHLYGPLPVSAVIGERRLDVLADGQMQFQDAR